MYSQQHYEDLREHEYRVVLPMYELKELGMNKELNTDLRKAINAKYIVRLTDSFGKVSLIGVGQLHKKIGVGGLQIAEDVCNEALSYKGSIYTKDLERGIRITFTKRNIV